MQALQKRFARPGSDVTAYGLIAAPLMLIAVAAWVIATAPDVAASLNQLGIMANTNDAPTSP